MKHSVLVVDDNAAIRSVVRSLFNRDREFEVVGEAQNGAEAIARAARFNPDLIVLDFSMPVMNGIEAAGLLRKRFPSVSIIMLTLYSDEEMKNLALKTGVQAFVSKDTAERDLMPAARSLFPPASSAEDTATRN